MPRFFCINLSFVVLEGILKVAPDTELGIEKMRKMTLAFMAAMMLLTISACKQDVYGELFVPREAVTFQVTTENGQALPDVSLMTEELDDFDYDLILNGTHDRTFDKAYYEIYFHGYGLCRF